MTCFVCVCDCSILYESALGMKLLVTALGIYPWKLLRKYLVQVSLIFLKLRRQRICSRVLAAKMLVLFPLVILTSQKYADMLLRHYCGGIGTAMLVSGEFSAAQTMNQLSMTIKIKQSLEGMQYGASLFFHSPTATLLFALVLLICSLGSKRENDAHVR
ncbi:hypothetical protein RHGRI_018806 [Rhododendron griersonianum]|uniref:Uncharacterized protein n=1 Tax=Rhododendron griersonianum TaxID=479676 RepID=A0AAV6K2S6_9ERIC|nr:hypothetical protein RHGRI_018806 [Rhododendron griersonianum]